MNDWGRGRHERVGAGGITLDQSPPDGEDGTPPVTPERVRIQSSGPPTCLARHHRPICHRESQGKVQISISRGLARGEWGAYGQ